MENRKAEVTVATRASDEQRAGIEEVNRAISQMDQVTQQNAVLVNHASEVVKTLQHQASHLNYAVGVFKTERSPSRPAHSMAADPKREADVPALLAEPEGA